MDPLEGISFADMSIIDEGNDDPMIPMICKCSGSCWYRTGTKSCPCKSGGKKCSFRCECGRLVTRCYWKASEWRSFLLFYSSFILQGILPARYLQYWFLLLFATHTLLKNELCMEDIDKAELTLKKFVIQTAVLYGKEHITFNIHQLCHWCESVRVLGSSMGTFVISI